MEDWVTIRNLKARNPDMGTRKIAELMGISRNTVKKALKSDAAPEYRRVSGVNEAIAPFEAYIKQAYLIKNLRVSRIFKELQHKGYSGSETMLYRYIGKHLKAQKGQSNAKAFLPYSTDPGIQMQYDWAEYVVQIDHTSVKIYLHQTILGYSRYKVFDVSLGMTQGDVLNALEESFHAFGGVCARIQVDNAKVFVDNAGKESFAWNRRFLHFCGFYGIKASRSMPGTPQSKGKVEKSFDYVEHHFILDKHFESFEDLRGKLKQFQEETNRNYHAAIKQTPHDSFAKEQEALRPLPMDPLNGEIKRYVGFKEEFRKVSSDCMIAYGGSRYSVPHHFVSQQVWVKKLYGTTLQVFSLKNRLIASHTLSLKKGEVIIDKAHFKGYRNDNTPALATSVATLCKRFAHYTNINRFIESTKAQKRINPGYHLHKMVGLFEYYSDTECIAAMEECFTYNTFNATVIKGYLSSIEVKEESLPNLFHVALPKGDVKRPLETYKIGGDA